MVVGILTDTSSYTCQSTEMYFQATMLMNIGTKYSALVSAIQKGSKDKKTNLEEAVLQIIRHFEFTEGNEQAKVMQTSTPSIYRALKGSCTNPECLTKNLTTHWTDRCWIKNLELWAKYALGRMNPRESQKNLCGGSTTQDTVTKTEPTPERDSWQPKILALRGPRKDCWLMDSGADVYVCNDLRLMTDSAEKPTRVGRSTSDGASPGRGTVQIRLALEDGCKRIILNLRNVFYLSNSPSNLISLTLLNDVGIYYNNEEQALYDKANQKPLVFAQRWEHSFLLHPLNLSVSAANLLKAEGDFYQDSGPKVYQN